MINSDNLYTILMTLCNHRMGQGGQDDKKKNGLEIAHRYAIFLCSLDVEI